MQFSSILVLKEINILEFIITRKLNFEHIIPHLRGPVTDAIQNGVDIQAITLHSFSTAASIDCFIKLFTDAFHSSDVAKRRFEMEDKYKVVMFQDVVFVANCYVLIWRWNGEKKKSECLVA